MKRLSWLISKYLIAAIVPYFLFSWLLLSVILFVQQASRYSDIFFSVNIPANLIWQLALALVPNVIAFTCPMAILVGTIIGLTRMQGDSELVAIRASGVGNLQIAAPIVLLGILLSVFAFFVNLKGVPIAASLVRNVALETAIKKLESPIEPGVFNSEVAGYTIYVRDGDLDTGRWRNIFIYTEDKAAGTARLITSKEGRIDTAGQLSELVLENAVSTTLEILPQTGKYVSENIGEVRFAIKTRRGDLIGKLTRSEISPGELGLQQVSETGAAADAIDDIEAHILWQRRITLSTTPLIFCLLGTVIVLRFNRGGRGFGIFLALVVLIGFYLLAFLGEQLARVGVVSVFTGSLMPIGGSLLAVIVLGFSRRISLLGGPLRVPQVLAAGPDEALQRMQVRNLFVDLTTGLGDFDILRNLLKNFLLTLSFLSAIFLIFTAFELWKFAGTMDGGLWLLSKYLFFLLPFIYLQIAPSAAMIGTLATYVIKSRQNEIVTWTSAGQSVYRLLYPCFLIMLLLGGVNWVIQERVLPRANQLQEDTRTLIRNRGLAVDTSGRQWVANEQRIYSFTQSDAAASDNEKQDCLAATTCAGNITVYEFEPKTPNLQTVYRADRAVWQPGRVELAHNVTKLDLAAGKSVVTAAGGLQIAERSNPFAEVRTKPNYLNADQLKGKIASSEADIDRRSLEVALKKKYTTLFLPFVMALFTAPFSLSLSRKGKAATVGYAVGLWLLFTGVSTVFEQLGLSGQLSAGLAVWSPLVIFSLAGTFLLSKVRT